MRAVVVSIAIGTIVVGCFNETGPTTTPPEVPPPTYACITFATYPTDTPDADLAFDAAIEDARPTDGSLPEAQSTATDAGSLQDAQSSFIDAGQPVVDAGLQREPYCEPARSVCANTEWVAYFDDGRCSSGMCQFTTKYHYCPGGCVDGLCATHQSGFVGGTAPQPPPKW